MNIKVEFSKEELAELGIKRSDMRCKLAKAFQYLQGVKYDFVPNYNQWAEAFRKMSERLALEEKVFRDPDLETDIMMEKTMTAFNISLKLMPDEKKEMNLSDIVLRELLQTCAGALADLEGIDFKYESNRETYLRTMAAKMILARVIEEAYKGVRAG